MTDDCSWPSIGESVLLPSFPRRLALMGRSKDRQQFIMQASNSRRRSSSGSLAFPGLSRMNIPDLRPLSSTGKKSCRNRMIHIDWRSCIIHTIRISHVKRINIHTKPLQRSTVIIACCRWKAGSNTERLRLQLPDKQTIRPVAGGGITQSLFSFSIQGS